MKIQTPPGMRDFYPDQMRLQNWLFDQWRGVSRAFGFEEYEGPIFEFLELYRLKSGEGIVSELFHFRDRGEREFAIRPEMTPTLARMVAARANALPRPIKWFSIPRMCRAERPQRGRLREFFQWNIDILGAEDALADAECIAVAAEFFRGIGLSAADIAIRISTRPLARAVLQSLGLPAEQTDAAFPLIDRFEKLDAAEFRRQWDERLGASVPSGRVDECLRGLSRPDALELAARCGADGEAAALEVERLWSSLSGLGVADYCEFDLRIVRGLAYYTGAVFEAHSRKASLRALLGGGRYDDLTSLLDGPKLPGVGFGAGDAPMTELLTELNRLPALDRQLDVFVIDTEAELFHDALGLAGRLREQRLSVDFSYRRAAIGKQLKQADARGARFVVLVGRDYQSQRRVEVKELGSGAQWAVNADELCRNPAACLAVPRSV